MTQRLENARNQIVDEFCDRAERSRGPAQEGRAGNRRQGARLPCAGGKEAAHVRSCASSSSKARPSISAKAAVRVTDDYVHDHPWASVGVCGGDRLRLRRAADAPLTARGPASLSCRCPDAPAERQGLRPAVTRVARALVGMLSTRAELASVEFTEERERLTKRLALVAGGGLAARLRRALRRCVRHRAVLGHPSALGDRRGGARPSRRGTGPSREGQGNRPRRSVALRRDDRRAQEGQGTPRAGSRRPGGD